MEIEFAHAIPDLPKVQASSAAESPDDRESEFCTRYGRNPVQVTVLCRASQSAASANGQEYLNRQKASYQTLHAEPQSKHCLRDEQTSVMLCPR